MVSKYMFQQIRALNNQGISQAEIARQLGIDPKTVAKYVQLNSPPVYRRRDVSTRVDSFLGFENKVRLWLERTPSLSEREIFELLLAEGYKGSERTINRRVKLVREMKKKERFFEQEYVPGEQSQFDFKEKVELPFVDGLRIVHLHFGTLPFSNACLVRGYPFKNYECFMDGIHNFFETLGGVTKAIRFDNLSPCVKKVLEGSDRLYTDAFKRALDHYGFKPVPCRPAKGSDKGDVERDIRTFASRIKNRVSHDSIIFRDFSHLNDWLSLFMSARQTDVNKEMLAQEKLSLDILACREDGVLCQVETMTATGHGSIRIDRSVYSVPDQWIEKKCDVVIGAYDVRIYLRERRQEPVVHPRMPYGENSLLLEHVLPSLVRKPQAMVRWAHKAILFPQPICHKFYAHLQRLQSFGAEREYLRSINLVLQISLSEIFAGMELVLESESQKPFEDLKDLLFGERRPCNVIQITDQLGLEPLKPELLQYDSLIPKDGS